MIFPKIKFHHFYKLTIIQRFQLPFYDEIINDTSKATLNGIAKIQADTYPKHMVHGIRFIPPFVDIQVNARFKKLTFNKSDGFLVDLGKCNSIDDYMSKQFGAKSRSKIRSNIRRLETCFDISYKFYFGDIDKTTCSRLMEALEHMIERRFDQRGEAHAAMQEWDYYTSTTYENILNRRASFFVIYDNDKPIDICLNFHFENIMINSVRAFDIDYSKFKLGYLDVYKQLELCFENDIKLFDLGPGILTYKKQWCNVSYGFKSHIIFNRSSILGNVVGYLLFLYYKLRIYLDKKNYVIDKEDRILDSVNNDNQEPSIAKRFVAMETIENPKGIVLSDYSKIDFEDAKFIFLREELFNQLYLNFDHKNQIKVLQSNSSPNTFILMGKKTLKLHYSD